MHRKKSSKQGDRSAGGWMPDVHAPNLAYECRRQSRLANETDSADPDLTRLMDAALDDLLLLCDLEERR